jgi:hypothetical protein
VDSSESIPGNGEPAPNTAVTKVALALGLVCVLGLICVAILFTAFSLKTAPDLRSIPVFMVRERTILSALAMVLASNCVVMGFLVCLLGMAGNIRKKQEDPLLRRVLASGVLGLVFLLCGTTIAVSVLFSKMTYEQSPGVTSAYTGTPATAAPPTFSSRTVAGSSVQRIALYTTETPIYNDLMEIGDPGPFGGALRHLIENESQVSVVIIDWDAQAKKPLSFQGRDLERNDARVLLSSGYLFVLDSDNAETIKDVLKAADSVETNFPSTLHLSEDSIAKIIKAGMTNRERFTRGDRSR